MSFATLLGYLDAYEMVRLQKLAAKADWRLLNERHDRLYSTAEVTDFWEPCKRAFFIRIGPGGVIHRHSDEAIKGTTHHLVLQSNPGCVNWWLEDGQEHSIHLAQRVPVRREARPRSLGDERWRHRSHSLTCGVRKWLEKAKAERARRAVSSLSCS